MDRFQKIAVCVDLGPRHSRVTPGSQLALLRARWLAARVGASVTLLHSSAPDESWQGDEGFVQSDPGLPEQGRRLLDDLAGGLRAAGIETDVAHTDEKAWVGIIRHVLREGTDLVLAGKRTDPRSDDRKLGLVATKLIRKCPCAVWVVDPRHEQDPERLLAATDLSPVGHRVVRMAGALAAALPAKLHVVHAFPLPLSIQMEGGAAEAEYDRRVRAEARAAIEKDLQGFQLAEKPSLHIGLDAPTRAILAAVDRLHPDLVVMGTLSRGGIPGLLVGNTAERLLEKLDCGLLTLKPDDFVCPISVD